MQAGLYLAPLSLSMFGMAMLAGRKAGQRRPAHIIMAGFGLSTVGMAAIIRPARKDEKQPRPFPNWLRQRVEAVIWTLKNQLGPERHGGRLPVGLWARIIQRLLALNACIWHNWLIGAPVKRSLIAYDHT
jgi:hypothetical protein